MELSRRDAIAALAAAGIGVGGAAVYTVSDDRPADGGGGLTADEPIGTLVSLADVLYPSSVEGTAEFVETYATGRFEDDDAHRSQVMDAVAVLDSRAKAEAGAAFRRLSVEERDDVLRALGQRHADPDPDGNDRQRVRYYLVNDLLYALFSSPKGGALAGTENPAGYPGGLGAYQQEPSL
ncbi:gluconate 2-dehydrogenase subunit 3 family protein (plasmid) [Halarchaeum sp. CBA1220]|uniref:gluconate 2-dehydrogenase subunit 3 family protein n=1 Tax=Halarchaeum sp. CBA1220 TaxID=1853682 RepID=UPI000F3A8C34|nr:gluconate 2-dehydrogenase subunit 3 family protein [Halarchaeum sp. CBA1220]QLC34816.1 gluconate 2-dehydrogenase subunit 3 family protein [Halarchaeum sp. CBA1220]